MKKIYALLFSALVLISFKLTAQDNNFTNDTVSIWVKSDGSGTLKEVKPIINNKKGVAVTFKLKKIILSEIVGAENTLCWSGICDPSFGNVTVSSSKTLAAGASSTIGDLVIDYNSKGTAGISEILYVIFNESNVNDSVYFKIKFRSVPGGVPGYNISGTPYIDFNTTTSVKNIDSEGFSFDAKPNPSDESTKITYSITNNNQSVLIVRNVIGSVVSEIPLSKSEGEVELNTKNLEAGIYFYSIVDAGKISATKKLIITR